jgi:hypothetical protein
MPLRESLVVDDKFLLPQMQESLSIAIAALGVDEDDEVDLLVNEFHGSNNITKLQSVTLIHLNTVIAMLFK